MRVNDAKGSVGFAPRPVLVVVAAKCALNLAFAGRYGWQRDELYYAVAGRHLQGGYVEFPPLTALLSALARVLFGWSLVGFRALAILAGAATIVVAALVARELGGGRRAQTLAAVAVGFSPLLLATNGLFPPVSFDQLTTMLVLWLALRLALGHGSWPWLGLAAGSGWRPSTPSRSSSPCCWRRSWSGGVTSWPGRGSRSRSRSPPCCW